MPTITEIHQMETDELTVHLNQPNDKDENVFYTLHDSMINANICPTAVTDKNLLYQQSAAISLCAISFNCIKDVEKWSTQTLYNVIKESNHFFELLLQNREFVERHLPTQFRLFDTNFLVSYDFQSNGFLHSKKTSCDTLRKIINEHSNDKTGLLFCLSDSCKLIIFKRYRTKKSKYYLFDPHTEAEDKKKKCADTPKLVTFHCAENLVQYFCNTYGSETGISEISYSLQIINCKLKSIIKRTEPKNRKHKSSDILPITDAKVAKIITSHKEQHLKDVNVTNGHFFQLFHKVVTGNISQGHPKFGNSAGKQCVAICLYAISLSCITDVARSTSNNLDYIVENGDKLYVSLALDRYLEVEDLPDHLCIANSVVNITRRFNISSILTADKDDTDAFTHLIEQNTNDNSGFLLWLREICIAVILKHNRTKLQYRMFDSHSRNKNGQVDEHGASILVVFNTIEYFVNYICMNYLNDNNNHRIPYVLQFLKCNSFKPLDQQKSVFQKLNNQDKQITNPDNVVMQTFKRTENSNNSHKNPSKRKADADIIMQNMSTTSLQLFESFITGNTTQAISKVATSIAKQCMAIGLYAISFQCLKDVARWTPTNLDSILENGNNFYHSLQAHVNLEGEDQQLPHQLSILDSTVNISYNFKTSGILTTEKNDIEELIKLIEQNTSNNNGFLLWLGEISVAVILKHNKRSTLKYRLFNSHTGQQHGKISHLGSSILITFNDIAQFIHYLCVTYLNKEDSNRISYVVQFLNCNCLTPLEKQRKTVRKLNSQTHQSLQPVEQLIENFHKNIKKGPFYICTVCNRIFYEKSVRKVTKDNYDCQEAFTDVSSYDGNQYICFTCHSKLIKRIIPCQATCNKLKLVDIPPELASLRKLESILVSQRLIFEKIVVMPKGQQPKVKGVICNIPVNCDTMCRTLPRPPENSGIIIVKLKRKLSYHGHQYCESVRPQFVQNALNYLKVNNVHYQNISINMRHIDKDLINLTNSQDELTGSSVSVIQSEGTFASETKESLTSDQTTTAMTEMSTKNAYSDKQTQNFLATKTDEDSFANQAISSHSATTITMIPTNNKEEGLDNSLCSNIIKDTKEKGEEEEEEVDDPQNQFRNSVNETCLQSHHPNYPTSIDLHVPSEQQNLDNAENPVSSAGNEVYSMAPGEGKHPIHFMRDKYCEELSFPTLFPTGQFGYQIERAVPLSPTKYFNARLLNYTGRFASNPEYLFFAQFITEQKKVQDSINIALKKVHGRTLTAQEVRNMDNATLRNLIFSDQAYTFMKNIPGSPSYWKRFMYDVLTMIKQLGPPTWWLTLSCADLRWKEIYKILSRLKGNELSDEEIDQMSYKERCDMLNSNPVVVAKHFQYRLERLFRDILLTDNNPIGKILYHAIRIEFQFRGSPHAHCFIWVKYCPELNEENMEIFVNYIDKYIAAYLPDPSDSPKLHELVRTYQTHSHSKTCRKYKNLQCRFNFGHFFTEKTVIAKPLTCEMNELEKSRKLKQRSTVLTKVKHFIN